MGVLLRVLPTLGMLMLTQNTVQYIRLCSCFTACVTFRSLFSHDDFFPLNFQPSFGKICIMCMLKITACRFLLFLLVPYDLNTISWSADYSCCNLQNFFVLFFFFGSYRKTWTMHVLILPNVSETHVYICWLLFLDCTEQYMNF